jgi:hypothetical protein
MVSFQLANSLFRRIAQAKRKGVPLEARRLVKCDPKDFPSPRSCFMRLIWHPTISTVLWELLDQDIQYVPFTMELREGIAPEEVPALFSACHSSDQLSNEKREECFRYVNETAALD